jgi:hypothetical protein
MIVAFRTWVAERGEPPASPDWTNGTQSHPMTNTLVRIFAPLSAADRVSILDVDPERVTSRPPIEMSLEQRADARASWVR